MIPIDDGSDAASRVDSTRSARCDRTKVLVGGQERAASPSPTVLEKDLSFSLDIPHGGDRRDVAGRSCRTPWTTLCSTSWATTGC